MDVQEVALLDLEPGRHKPRAARRSPTASVSRVPRTGRRPPPRRATIACGTAPAAPPTGSRRSSRCRCRPRTPGCAAGSSARRVRGDPRSPHLERQCRIVRVRTQLVPAGDRPRRRPRAAGRSCPSAWRRGSAARSARRRPGSQRHAAVQSARRRARPRARRPEGRSRTPRSAATPSRPARRMPRRPVSIGLMIDPVTVELEDQELAAPRDALEHLALERGELGRRAPHDQRLGRRRRPSTAVPRAPRRWRRRGWPGRAVRASARS